MNQENRISIDLSWLVLMLAIPLLLQNSWVEGMFYDGHLYAAFGKNAAEKGHWLVPHLIDSAYPQFSQHPPFVFILEGIFFKIFGVSVVSARMFVSLFVLLTLGFIFKSSKDERDKTFALIGAFLFIIIPPLLKKSRFPNMDIPLMLFVFGALYKYYKAQLYLTKINWVYCGIYFGLALLSKGAMGLLVPAGIGFHLIFSKRWKNLLMPGFWGAFCLGLGIFSLWPLSLMSAGKYHIFQEYLGYVFGLGKGEYATDFHSPFYTYPLFLIKQTPHLLIPFCYGLYRWLKKKECNDFVIFSYACFFGMMTLLTFSSVKVSNYLLPLYPFYAICAAWGLLPLIEKYSSKFKMTVFVLAFAAPLVLLIFPLTNKSRRDQPLYKSLDVLSRANKVSSVKNWNIVQGVYPFWNVANWVGWKGLGNAYSIDDAKFLESIKSNDSSHAWLLSLKRFEEMNDKENFIQLYRSEKEKLVIMIKKSVLDSSPHVQGRK
ncbi:MAG: glycosyltransferase family 39 protein [Bacteriovoracaceae bacterium]|nr:glycosyltransferase family 39 protein [Bacteriovoracaceae bacterium]